MAIAYEDSYLGQVRQLVGNQTLFAITARAIVQDEARRILLVRRDEISDAHFFPHDALPNIPEIYRETPTDLDNYQGRLIVK